MQSTTNRNSVAVLQITSTFMRRDWQKTKPKRVCCHLLFGHGRFGCLACKKGTCRYMAAKVHGWTGAHDKIQQDLKMFSRHPADPRSAAAQEL